jgi:hypothetical protein
VLQKKCIFVHLQPPPQQDQQLTKSTGITIDYIIIIIVVGQREERPDL